MINSIVTRDDQAYSLCFGPLSEPSKIGVDHDFISIGWEVWCNVLWVVKWDSLPYLLNSEPRFNMTGSRNLQQCPESRWMLNIFGSSDWRWYLKSRFSSAVAGLLQSITSGRKVGTLTQMSVFQIWRHVVKKVAFIVSRTASRLTAAHTVHYKRIWPNISLDASLETSRFNTLDLELHFLLSKGLCFDTERSDSGSRDRVLNVIHKWACSLRNTIMISFTRRSRVKSPLKMTLPKPNIGKMDE